MTDEQKDEAALLSYRKRLRAANLPPTKTTMTEISEEEKLVRKLKNINEGDHNPFASPHFSITECRTLGRILDRVLAAESDRPGKPHDSPEPPAPDYRNVLDEIEANTAVVGDDRVTPGDGRSFCSEADFQDLLDFVKAAEDRESNHHG